MKLEDLRQQVRAELAAVDPDGTADPAEIDRLVREVIVFLSTSAEDQVNAAARIAEASPSPRDRELWLRRAERLRQGLVALQVALNELGPAPHRSSAPARGRCMPRPGGALVIGLVATRWPGRTVASKVLRT
jgi:hypothetical protein